MNNEIQLKTENFDSPFDILLFLLDNKKIDMRKVILSDIIDEYLKLIENEKKQNLKVKVEFLAMATELLEIKAYSVLSIDKKNEKEQDLEKRLYEYKIIKEIAKEFAKREIVENISHNIEGKKEKIKAKNEYRIDKIDINFLEKIIKKFDNISFEKEKIQIKFEDLFTTKDAIIEINNKLSLVDKIKFSELFGFNFNKNRIVCFSSNIRII